MQLRLSIAAASLIITTAVQAEDYVSVQFMQYDENNNRTSVSAPSITINKDFGTDYTLNISAVSDAVSGGSPTAIRTDTASGASAYNRGQTDPSNVSYENVDYKDNRVAGNILLISRFDNRDELTVGISYSSESDFYGKEASAEYMHWLGSDKNQALSFGLSAQANEVLIRDCTNNSNCSAVDTASGASSKETNNAISAQLSFSQNIDQNSYIKAAAFYSTEDGYLSSPYHNIVREVDASTDVLVEAEIKPDARQSYGVSLHYANALTKSLAWQAAYRYYIDDWGIDSHTLDNDLYYTLADDWTFKLGLRVYSQSEADFYEEFNTNGSFSSTQTTASSDERMSSFTALTYKTGVDYQVSKDVSVNISANMYEQDSYSKLKATYFIAGFTYNF